MTYQWLLFDADGTIFDYERAELRSLESTFEQFGLPLTPDGIAAYHQINHDIWLAFERGDITSEALRVRRFELLFEVLHLQASADAFSAQYLRNLSQCTDLIPGAEQILQAMQGRFRLAIITNGLTDVQYPRLAQSTVVDYFEVVVVSEEIGANKPDTRFFDVTFERIGQPPRSAVLVIGDSLTSDMRGGIDYGLDTCWFNPGRKPRRLDVPVRYEIQRLPQLLELLENEG